MRQILTESPAAPTDRATGDVHVTCRPRDQRAQRMTGRDMSHQWPYQRAREVDALS